MVVVVGTAILVARTRTGTSRQEVFSFDGM